MSEPSRFGEDPPSDAAPTAEIPSDDASSEDDGTRELRVGPAEEGQRLDYFLATKLGISRANVRRALARGVVSWRGRPADPAAKGAQVHEGDELCVREAVDPRSAAPIPEPDRALQILAEGPGWCAVDKPAGTPVHPLEPHEQGTLLNALAARHPQIVGVGEGGLRSGVVHRLDVDTSGVLLFATEASSWERLRDAFRRHRVEKLYWALVQGRLEGEGELSLTLTVSQHRPARVRVVDAGGADGGRGRLTQLAWRSLRASDAASLVEVRPVTGFLHQIRASLAHLGHPLLGDPAYGGPEDPRAPRHLLHARHVRHREIEAESEPPDDFANALEAFLG